QLPLTVHVEVDHGREIRTVPDDRDVAGVRVPAWNVAGQLEHDDVIEAVAVQVGEISAVDDSLSAGMLRIGAAVDGERSRGWLWRDRDLAEEFHSPCVALPA